MVTALLCSGAALPREVWRPLIAAAPDLRWHVVERPGLDRAVTGRTITAPSLGDGVARIRATASEVAGPVVLVAHSMAAFPVEAALRHGLPGVVGVVLVDPSVGPEPPLLAACADMVATLASWAPRRLLRRTLGERDPWWMVHLTRSGALAAGTAEAAAYNRWYAELSRIRENLPSLPAVTVRLLSVSRRAPGTGDWLRVHRSLAQSWSTAGAGPVEVVACRGTHLLMHSRPDLVAAAVRAVGVQAG